MENATRRQVLHGAGLLAGVIALTSCDTAPPQGSGGSASGGTGGSGGPLTWWDQFNPLQDLHRSTFKKFTDDGGPAVEYTVYNPNDQGKALQLAFSSKQLPDVFTLAGFDVPPSVLLAQGWFAPLATEDAIRKALPEGAAVPGLHIFDDKLHSFSIFSFRQYETLVWGNRELQEKAGLDPDQPPASWDDLRAAAKKMTQGGGSGLILPLKFAQRMGTFVHELAQTAGFPGSRLGGTDGIDLNTGEYRYHDDAFVESIEFLRSFQQDGTLFKASTSLDARAGRARWAAGASGFFLDGPWNAGVVSGDFKPMVDKLAVGSIPTPSGDKAVITRPPIGGTFWVAKQSEQAEQASKLLERFLGKEYQTALAVAMDQPPLDLDAVAGSDAHDTYKKAIELFKEQVFLGPTPQAREGVTAVEAEMPPAEPGLGGIVQGAFSGQVKDVRAALQKLSENRTKARDAAIAKVGGGISVDAWAFPDWKAGEDFGPERYAK